MTFLTVPVSNRDYCQGSENALVTLVEYGNYQCADCLQANQVIQTIQTQLGAIYNGEEHLRFVFRQFFKPEIHPMAQNAAEASLAAAVQGQFWEMHHCLFSHQHILDDAVLVECADAIKLNIEQFLYEMSEHIHANRVREIVESGKACGVTTTPTFFINNHRYDGAWDTDTLLSVIQAKIEET